MQSTTNKMTRRWVRFELAAAPECRVFVAGSFNQWDGSRTRMKPNPHRGMHSAMVSIPPGEHEYRFVVDGQWLTDPECPEAIPNPYGSLNSVLRL